MSVFREIVEIWAVFRSSKNVKLVEHKHVIHHFKTCDLEITNINLFNEIFKFRDFKRDL